MSDDILHNQNSHSGVQKSNSIGGTNGAPNPRSCVTCRRRKVKCDKKQPCSNCVRAKIECVFPGPGRAPRKSRKPPDGELLDRLRRLEGVVQTLNAQVEEHEQEAAERESKPASSGCPNSPRASSTVAVDNSVEGLENRFGRLVVDHGRSRYINNSFWASLNNEVARTCVCMVERTLTIYRSKISSQYSLNRQTTRKTVRTRRQPPTPPRNKALFSVSVPPT
jgi:hypothetical protein